MARKNKVIKIIFKVGILCAYVLAIGVLVWQALTPGSTSADISNNVGDKIDEIVTDIQKPEAEVVKVQSVEIISATIGSEQLDLSSAVIPIGGTAKIKTQVLPSNASNPALSYSSSNESIAVVYPNGSVEGVAVGSATITVSSQENPLLKDSFEVSIINIPIEDLAISNAPENNELQVGQTHRLEINFTPKNTSQKQVSWVSSNPEILTVNANGVLKAISQGEVTITLTSAVDSQIFDTVTVKIVPKVEDLVIPVEGISIILDRDVLYIGEQINLKATITPNGATDGVVWSSSNEEIATISQSGALECKKAGVVTISVKCSNYEFSDSLQITVKEVLSSTITLQTENLTSSGENAYSIKAGASGKVIATLDENATVKQVVFSSSDESVAKVNSDGVIEAVSGGTVTITATTSYDGKTTTASFTLTVNRVTFSDTIHNFYYVIRKSFGHFGAFLVLGILASLTYFSFFAKTLKGKIWGFVVCLIAGFAVASLTEILQLPIFTAGRYCSFKDVMLDFKGYITSALPIYFIIFTHHFIKIFIAKRKAKKTPTT